MNKMIDKERLLKEVREAFDKDKELLRFRSSFDDVNDIISIDDMVLSQGYVGSRNYADVRHRFMDLFNNWVGMLHAWLMPNPQDLIFMNEAKKLNEDEKKEIFEAVRQIMYLLRKSRRISTEGKNLSEEGAFLDELVEYWKSSFQSFALKYSKKFEDAWNEKP